MINKSKIKSKNSKKYQTGFTFDFLIFTFFLYSFFPITTAPTIALKNKMLLISKGTT